MSAAALMREPEADPGRLGQRRRLLGTALAVTAGGSMGAFAPIDALAQARPAAGDAAAEASALCRRRSESPMQAGIDACIDCHSMCFRMAMTFCLEKGGRHVAPRHLRLMLNCAELCQTSADFMLSDSPMHGRVCLSAPRPVKRAQRVARRLATCVNASRNV